MESPKRHRTRSHCSHINRLSQLSSELPELPPGDSCQSVHCDLPPESPIQWKHGICSNTSTVPPFGEADLEMPLSISFLDAVVIPVHMINKSDYEFTRCARVMCFNVPLKMCGPTRPPQSDDSDSSCETKSPQQQLRTRSWAHTQCHRVKDSSADQLSTDKHRKAHHLSSSVLSKDTVSVNSQKSSQSFSKTAVKVNHLLSLCMKLKDSQKGTEMNKPEIPVANQPSTKMKKKQKSAVQANQWKVGPVVGGKSQEETLPLESCISHVGMDYFGQVSPVRTSDHSIPVLCPSPQVIREVTCQNTALAKSQESVQHECPDVHLYRRDGSQQQSVCKTDLKTPQSEKWESPLITSDKNHLSCSRPTVVRTPQSQKWESAPQKITADKNRPFYSHSTDVRCQLPGQAYLSRVRAWLTSQLEPSGNDDWNQLLSPFGSMAHDSSHASATRLQGIPVVTDSMLDIIWDKTLAQPASLLSAKYEDLLEMFLEAVIIILARGNINLNERAPSENSGGKDVLDSLLSQEAKTKPSNTANVNKSFSPYTDNSNHQHCERSTEKWQEASNPQQCELSTKKYELSTQKWQKPSNHQQCEHSTQKQKAGCQLLPRPLFLPAGNSGLRWPPGIDDEEFATPTEQVKDHYPTDSSYRSSFDVDITSACDMSQMKQKPKKTIIVLRKQIETLKTCDQQTVVHNSKQTQYVPVKKSHKQDKCPHISIGGSSDSRKAHHVRSDPPEDSWFKRMLSKNEQIAATEADFLAFVTKKLDTIQHKLTKKLLDKRHALPEDASDSMINRHLRCLPLVFEITKQHARKQFPQ
ncbi:hypothetical protein BsWGS_08392 [Bradybaena similaris]